MNKVIAIDLFCGIGGLSHGLEESGINVSIGIDADSSCKYAFEKNNNSRFLNKDIKQIELKDIATCFDVGSVRVVVGCAPCQPFSNHQKNKFNRDTHKDWGLLYEFIRIVKEVSPHVVSMENVPQLRHEKIFDDFVYELENLNYNVSVNIVNAADYGVPQRRKRLILLASKFGDIQLLPPTHLLNKITVSDAIGNLPPIESGDFCRNDVLHASPKLSDLNLKRIKVSKPGGTWQDWDESLRCNCHKKANGKTYSSVYGRMCWDDVSPTITTQFTYYGTGRFGHPDQNRAISLREGALLQSFPMTYDFIESNAFISKKMIARHIGNAVPPRLGFIIGKSILSHIQTEKNYGTV